MSKGLTVRTKGKLDHPDEPRQLVHATERGGALALAYHCICCEALLNFVLAEGWTSKMHRAIENPCRSMQ